MASFKKVKLNPSGTLSLLKRGRPSNETLKSVVEVDINAYKALQAGKRVRFNGGSPTFSTRGLKSTTTSSTSSY